MSDVIGHERITLRPGDQITYNFYAPPCTSAIANDGAIPFGTTVSTADVKGYKAGVDKSTELIAQSSVSNNIVQVQLKFPATTGAGKYQLRFALTLSNGEKLNLRYDEIYAVKDN